MSRSDYRKPGFGTRLPRTTPAQAGVREEDIEAMIREYAKEGMRIHSFILVRNGFVFGEGYYSPYDRMQPQTVYSLSKSFTSAAVGIACSDGILSLEERIADIFADELTESFEAVKSVMINVNPKNTNVIMGDRTYCVGGAPYINDILCGVGLRISANSFYQVNRNMAEYLYKLALRLADADKNTAVADLYCGIGSIGLSMAKYVKAVAGVEIVPEAVECARVNAAINNIENASFFLGDAGDSSKLFSEVVSKLGQVPDVVILDPPRKGSTKELIDCIADFSVKKAVYVSCNPDTLARDCAYFAQKGYSLSEVYPVDLFPRTGHVETLVLLSHK